MWMLPNLKMVKIKVETLRLFQIYLKLPAGATMVHMYCHTLVPSATNKSITWLSNEISFVSVPWPWFTLRIHIWSKKLKVSQVDGQVKTENHFQSHSFLGFLTSLESWIFTSYSYEFCFRKKLSSLWTKKFHFHCKRNNFALVLATLSIYYAAQLTCICIKMCIGCACNFQSRKRPSCYWTSFLVISGSTFST